MGFGRFCGIGSSLEFLAHYLRFAPVSWAKVRGAAFPPSSAEKFARVFSCPHGETGRGARVLGLRDPGSCPPRKAESFHRVERLELVSLWQRVGLQMRRASVSSRNGEGLGRAMPELGPNFVAVGTDRATIHAPSRCF